MKVCKYVKKTWYSVLSIFSCMLIINGIHAQDQADRTFLWDFGDSGLGFWKRAYNCGKTEQPGGQDYTKTVKITYGSTERQRFPNSPSVKFWTDASINETCNQNKTAERAELNAEASYRSVGAKEGETMWFGWSDMWTDIDNSHITTFLQFRNNCGSGGPGVELVMHAGKELKIRTFENNFADIGTIRENVWYDFVAEIKYSKSNNGYIKVWMFEGNSQFPNHAYTATATAQVLNTKTMKPDDACPHLRWGVYRHQSADKYANQIKPEDRVVVRHMGPVRIHRGSNLGANGFKRVVPRNISQETEPPYNPTPPAACQTLTNLAFQKQTNQSSLHRWGTSNKAVDQYTTGIGSTLEDHGTSHTGADKNAWWEVDLGKVYTISQITYKGRTDCCQNRLVNAQIMVSQQKFKSTSLSESLNNSEIWSTKRAEFPNPSITINTGNIRGRYLRIQLEGTGYLSLADVRVMGCESPDQEPPSEPEEPTEPEEPVDPPTDPPAESCDSPSNVALEKPARQSSTYGNGTADRAVDTDERTDQGPWRAGGVTHTLADQNAWWEVDLGETYDISKIEYTGRTDCCKERLEDAYILVSNQPFGSNSLTNSLANQNIWRIKQSDFPDPTISIETGSVRGRYVRIQLEGRASLSLADVKVMGCIPSGSEPEEPIDPPTSSCNTPGNLALEKPASQSSTYGNGSPDRAVDTDERTDQGPWRAGGVTHTQRDQNAWWEVDLGQVYDISTIEYTGRTDCCKERLENAYVLVSKQPFGSSSLSASLANQNVWQSKQTDFPDPKISIPTGGIQGRYVRIQLEGRASLSLADVKVMGCPPQSSSQAAFRATDSDVFGNSGSDSRGQELTRIFPNVANEKVFIDLPSDAFVSLTNINGVNHTRIRLNAGMRELNLSNVPEGVYVVVSESSYRTSYKKIIVRH